MTISAQDVRRLVDSEVDDAVLVLCEGRVEVLSPDQERSDRYRGALRVASRRDVLATLSGRGTSDHELEVLAAQLDSGVSTMGG